MHLQARDELEERARSLESELLEARERHIQETEAHSARAVQVESELKDAQEEVAKWMQQQQASHRKQADVEALQQECQQLRARLQDAEATSQVQCPLEHYAVMCASISIACSTDMARPCGFVFVHASCAQYKGSG